VTIYDIILYSLILLGAIIGITIGVYVAFDNAKCKIEEDENPYYVKPKAYSSEFGPAVSDEANKEPSVFKKWNERRSENRKRKLEEKTGRETETYKSLKDRVSARDEINSFTDSSCEVFDKDTAESIQQNRIDSNQAYEYIRKKKDNGDSQ